MSGSADNQNSILLEQITVDYLWVYAAEETLVVAGRDWGCLHEGLEGGERVYAPEGGLQQLETAVQLEVELRRFRAVVFQHLGVAQVQTRLREKRHVETTPESFLHQKLTHILALNKPWALLKHHEKSILNATIYLNK